MVARNQRIIVDSNRFSCLSCCVDCENGIYPGALAPALRCSCQHHPQVLQHVHHEHHVGHVYHLDYQAQVYRRVHHDLFRDRNDL
mmetsp:Transcript_52758/g.122683  ORF Transcript_52758/g.122683 Transcript_52758/m.122683 type:complete len:85 (-) Transcript_52758:14-268(-)